MILGIPKCSIRFPSLSLLSVSVSLCPSLPRCLFLHPLPFIYRAIQPLPSMIFFSAILSAPYQDTTLFALKFQPSRISGLYSSILSLHTLLSSLMKLLWQFCSHFASFTFLWHQEPLDTLWLLSHGFHYARSSFCFWQSFLCIFLQFFVSLNLGFPKWSFLGNIPCCFHSCSLGAWFNFTASTNSSIQMDFQIFSYPDFSPKFHPHISNSTSNNSTWILHPHLCPLPLWDLSHSPSWSNLIITTLVQMFIAFCLVPLKVSLVAFLLPLLKFITYPTTKCIFQNIILTPFEKPSPSYAIKQNCISVIFKLLSWMSSISLSWRTFPTLLPMPPSCR